MFSIDWAAGMSQNVFKHSNIHGEPFFALELEDDSSKDRKKSPCLARSWGLHESLKDGNSLLFMTEKAWLMDDWGEERVGPVRI